VLAAVCAAALACNPGKGKVAYVGAELYDGGGGPVTHDAVILVAGGHVEAVGTPDLVSVPRGAEIVRLDGRWVIPGLVDGHAHAARWTLSRFLAYGVTTVRSSGGPLDSSVALRDEVGLMTTPGPRLYIAGAVIDGSPPVSPDAIAVANGDDARRAVDRLTLVSADFAKVYTRIDRRLLRPLMDEASSLALPVAGHLGRVDAVTAAQLGVKSLEHMTGIVEATVRDPARFYRAHGASYFGGWNLVERTWASLDSAALERTARTLHQADVTIVPTLVLREALTHLRDSAYIALLDWSGVPDSVRTAWDLANFIRRGGFDAATLRATRASRPRQDLFVRMYRRLGGRVVAGTDSPNPMLAPGASLHDEMRLLVAAGLTPEEALAAATREAARLLGADSIGVIAAGSVADFVVLTADPLADIANTRRIERVVARGTSYDPNELKAGW
jgi:imidazolonepropionase-like amidohydrolase